MLIDSLLDLHEHGGDTGGLTIISNTTAEGLSVELSYVRMLGGWLVCWPELLTLARAFTLASAVASSARKHESVSVRKEICSESWRKT